MNVLPNDALKPSDGRCTLPDTKQCAKYFSCEIIHKTCSYGVYRKCWSFESYPRFFSRACLKTRRRVTTYEEDSHTGYNSTSIFCTGNTDSYSVFSFTLTIFVDISVKADVITFLLYCLGNTLRFGIRLDR
jgi:hypothetical protein